MPFVHTFEIETFVDTRRYLPIEYQSTFAKMATAFPSIHWPSISRPYARDPVAVGSHVHFKPIPSREWPNKAGGVRHLREAIDQWMPGIPIDMVTLSVDCGGERRMILQASGKICELK
ncbi:hypothetical protein C8J57DRAFT_1500893 [Mycena rebaudengoi]|nr:hypothetical protein C8J57DRAFT_1500893 [Mycena rebaudengoi]